MEHPEELTHKIEEQMDKIEKIEEGIEKFTQPDKH